jgi:hypothetical protein
MTTRSWPPCRAGSPSTCWPRPSPSWPLLPSWPRRRWSPTRRRRRPPAATRPASSTPSTTRSTRSCAAATPPPSTGSWRRTSPCTGLPGPFPPTGAAWLAGSWPRPRRPPTGASSPSRWSPLRTARSCTWHGRTTPRAASSACRLPTPRPSGGAPTRCASRTAGSPSCGPAARRRPCWRRSGTSGWTASRRPTGPSSCDGTAPRRGAPGRWKRPSNPARSTSWRAPPSSR